MAITSCCLVSFFKNWRHLNEPSISYSYVLTSILGTNFILQPFIGCHVLPFFLFICEHNSILQVYCFVSLSKAKSRPQQQLPKKVGCLHCLMGGGGLSQGENLMDSRVDKAPVQHYHNFPHIFIGAHESPVNLYLEGEQQAQVQ